MGSYFVSINAKGGGLLEDRFSLMSTTKNRAQVKKLIREECYKGISIDIKIPIEPMKVFIHQQ
jgi:hypothetical protein